MCWFPGLGQSALDLSRVRTVFFVVVKGLWGY